MKRRWTVAAPVVAGLCLFAAESAAQTAHSWSDGHPDLSGVWNGAVAARVLSSGDKQGLLLSAREGTLINFERDNALLRRMDPNKPVYRPEFWEKVAGARSERK